MFGGADASISELSPSALPGSPKSRWLFGEKEEQGSGLRFCHKAKTESNALCSDVVEARRIELLSENVSGSGSPSAAYDLDSPRRKLTGKLAPSVASWFMAGAKLTRRTFTAKMMPLLQPQFSEAGQLPLIRQQLIEYCRLFLKNTAF